MQAAKAADFRGYRPRAVMARPLRWARRVAKRPCVVT